MLRIAIPNKGRLADDTRVLFADAGLEVRASSDRTLSASLGEEFQALLVRAEDIPEFVADGAADLGVTGWDLVRESGRELHELLDLGFGRCRLVVAAADDVIGDGLQARDGRSPLRVATVFPRITGEYFDQQGLSVELVSLSGACEIAPRLGIADVVVDITSTGATLRNNGLRELATVLCSSARLVAAPQPAGASPDSPVGELVTALDSVLRARHQRYLMANVPRAALDAVKQVLPGLTAPTVIGLLNGGTHVAVHAVVPSQAIYRRIAQLRQLGAEGILVTRIERLLP